MPRTTSKPGKRISRLTAGVPAKPASRLGRTPCTGAGAYWLMRTLRAALPARASWRHGQFDTLRLRLIKIAARVIGLKTRIAIHLPTACPAAPLIRLLLGRLPRMAPA